jgi:hypothetical protein
MAHRTKFTLKAREDFIARLREGDTVTAAARQVNLSRRALYDHKAADPEFSVEWDEALDEGVEVLEQEAKRRAVDGTLKPVFHQGQECGYIREYSDSLLSLLLKAKKPKVYRENASIEHTGKDGGPIETHNVLPVSEQATRLAALFEHVAQTAAN